MLSCSSIKEHQSALLAMYTFTSDFHEVFALLRITTPMYLSLTQVSSVWCAPQQWGSHGEETRGPQEHNTRGGDRKSIQSE